MNTRVSAESQPDSKVEVERHYADNLPLVPMDADLCDRVFTNLVLNAYQAMPEGGKLTLRIAVAAPGVVVEIVTALAPI